MALQFQIIVIAKHALMPFDGLARSGNVAGEYFLGHFTCYAGRTNNEVLVVALQVDAVGTGPHVIAVDPRPRNQFDEVLVSVIVLGKYDQMVTALVFTSVFLFLGSMLGHIHLAAEDRLEGLFSFFLEFLVDTVAIVEKLFDAKHVAMVGDSHSPHAVGNSLVDKSFDARLSVENRIICMYVKMNEILHVFLI